MQIELDILKKRLYKDSAVKNVNFFPGSNRDVTAEDIAREVNKFYAEAEAGQVELIEFID